MIGTLLYRLKAAFLVLIGKSKIEHTTHTTHNIKSINNEKLQFTAEEQDFLSKISMEFIFAEFGENRINGGGSEFSISMKDRLNPSLETLRIYFPNAKYTVYSDFDLEVDGVELKKVISPVIQKEHSRYGYRTTDYYKFYGLFNSNADFKCVLDSDMQVISSDIIALIYLTQKFGFCVPYNPRQLLRFDMKMSKDAQEILDESMGLGHSYNQSPMTLWKSDERGNLFYKTCAEIMKEDPSRASLVMWKSAWKTGIYPYVLPKQFCVCAEDIGCGDEVMLHVGHPKVKKYYNL